MKFTKNTFLILGMASIFSIAWIGDGMAADAPAGKFRKNGANYDCRPGCYCLGGANVTTTKDLKKACENRDLNVVSKFPGVNLCPENFPRSKAKAESIFDCYNESGENYLDTYISCPVGKYLPKNSAQCADCLDGYRCPGIRMNRTNPDADIRLIKCPTGKVANAEHTDCIEPDDQEQTVHCIRGEYLPANSESCAECPDGYYCPNEKDYPINRAVSQGNERCTGNKVPNDRKDDCVPCSSGKEPDEDHATCVDAKIHVDPGQYLRANSTDPISCSGSVKKFCPGGSFYKKSVDQGKYDCPFNSNANSTNTACELKLTKKQMVNGVSGNGECWLKTDPEDYKLCIYGARFENASNTPTSSSTNNAATELKGFALTLKNK